MGGPDNPTPPMQAAAREGRVDVLQFLWENGAEGDLKRTCSGGEEPMMSAAINYRNSIHPTALQDILRWFILKGALCSDDEARTLDQDAVRSVLGPTYVSLSISHLEGLVRVVDERPGLLSWAKEAQFALDKTLFEFLSVQHRCAKTSSAHSLHRILGAMPIDANRAVAGFLGAPLGRELKIVRQLGNCLEEYLDDVPVGHVLEDGQMIAVGSDEDMNRLGRRRYLEGQPTLQDQVDRAFWVLHGAEDHYDRDGN